MRRGIWSLGILVLLTLAGGCQSGQKKAERNLAENLIYFSALESRIDKTCLIETKISEPTLARYQLSFPEESKLVVKEKNFIWKVKNLRCEIEPTGEGEGQWLTNHEKITEAVLCQLLMGFQLQSPLEGPKWLELPREYSKGQNMWTWRDPLKGVSQVLMKLDPLQLEVKSSKGITYQADYLIDQRTPRLTRLSRQFGASGLQIDQIKLQNLNQGQVQTVFPREISRFELSLRDESEEEFRYYGELKVLRCE